MNSIFASFPLLQQAGGDPTMAFLWQLLPIVGVVAIFYFLLIRPQNKKQKELEKMLASLRKGDKVVTIGGIHGLVTSTKETTVIVKVDDNCKIEFSRSAIQSITSRGEEKTDSVEEKTEEKK